MPKTVPGAARAAVGTGFLAGCTVGLGTLVLLCAGAATAGPQADIPPREPVFTSPNPAANGSSLTDQQQRQLQIFRDTLLNPSSDVSAEVRRNAAQELLAMNVPEAVAVLDQALRSQKAPLMLAAISVMQAAPEPVEGLHAAAVAALPGAPTAVVESLSWAVARYGQAALDEVAPMALNRNEIAANRFAPIQALSSFDSQAAAAALMKILETPDEPAEIIAAACDGLQRLSGLAHGLDAAPWRQWWKEAGALPADQWSAYITKSLSKRAAQLQQDLQKQRETTDAISRELVASYRDLFPSLATEEQFRRLPNLLQNSLAPLREFAVGRIAVLSRDSVRIPIDVQHRLAERLNDESPALRIQTAKLLDELNYESTAALLAARLGAEPSPQVVAAMLDVLAKRPNAAAIDPVQKWLGDPELGEKAVSVMWRAHEAGWIVEEKLSAIRIDIRRGLRQRTAPALLRLLAWFGDDTDLPSLTQILDNDDPALRAAVAEGFYQRGLRQPLIDRAGDTAVYPFALRAVADGPADLAALRLLVSWQPTDDTRQQWNESVGKLAGKLTNGDLLAADEILAAAPAADPSLRITILNRALALPREQFNGEQRSSAVVRLAPLLIESGEPGRALTLLEGLAGNAPETQPLLFQAAALCGQYEKAVAIQADPQAWVKVLTLAARHDLPAAAPLCQEIARRFAGRLTPQDQSTVDEIAEAIRNASAAATAS